MSSESPGAILYDSNGNALAVQNAAIIPASTSGLIILGSDGTNSRYISVDASGRQIIVGAGVAGTPAGGVVSVQGVSGMTALTVNNATATNLLANVGGLAAAGATSSGNPVWIAGNVTTSAPTYANNTINALSITTGGLLRVDGTGGSFPVSGTVTANQGTANTTANAWPTKVTDGTNTSAVKAASTSAVATDPALVVAISPNIGVTGRLPVTLGDPGTEDIFSQIITGHRLRQIETQFFTQAPSNIINITTTSTATATQGTGTAIFSTGTGTTAEVKGVSFNTVTYSAHNEVYAAMTASFTTPTSAASYQRLGIYDTNNGFAFGYNGTTFGLWTRYNGVDTFVSQASWNTDVLAGAAGSKFTNNNSPVALVQTNINLYRIRYGWLGIAPVVFEVLSPDGNFVIVHTVRYPNSQTTVSVSNPNLPLTVDVSKTASDATNLAITCGCWVAGVSVSGAEIVASAGGNETNIHLNSTITTSGSIVINCKDFGNQQISLIINVTNAPTGTNPTIQFFLQEVDPGNNLTVMGNLIESVQISGTGVYTATLYTTVSTNVKVNWVVSGTTPSFTGIYTTLVSKSTSGSTFAGGQLRVQLEASELFLDSYNTGTLDTTNLWTAVHSGSGTAPVVSAGSLTIGSGTSANGYSYIQSIPVFQTVSPGWLNIDHVIAIENPVLIHAYRFWGVATIPGSPTATAPLTDAVGWEIGTDGKLYAVCYAGGTRNLIQDLSAATGSNRQPTDSFPHTYTVFFRGNSFFWCIDNYDYVVAQAPNGASGPNNGVLPLLEITIAASTPPSSTATIQSSAVFVGDTTHSNTTISDGTFGFRRAVVKAASTAAAATDTALTVSLSPNSPISGQYNITPPSPTNGQSVITQSDQSGNTLEFPGIQVKTGAAWTSATGSNTAQYPTGTTAIGAPLGCETLIIQLDQTTTITAGAVTFEGSYDGINWITIPAAQILNPQTFAQLTNPYTFVASTNQAFIILLNGMQQVRLRLSTVITGTGSVTPYWSMLASSPISYSATVSTPNGGFSVLTGSIGATKTAIKTSLGSVFGWYFYNSNSTVAYVQFFNATTGNVTLGTTAPFMSLGVPPLAGANVMCDNGIYFSTAISIAITTTRAGSTGPTNTVDYNIFYL